MKEIRDLSETSSSSVLRYLEGKSEKFGGNLGAHERFSYFDHQNETIRVPCGFFKDFPISDSDRMAMENCRGVVVVSAIFNDHDKIRQPRGLGPETIKNACFHMFVDNVTLNRLKNHNLVSENSSELSIGAWRIVVVKTDYLYENPAMNGVIPKYLVHRLFPNAKFSIWIDAKLQLRVDPLLLIHALVVSQKADMAISKHPFFVHTMEEAMATARWKKWWDVEGLKRQMETYCEYGLQPWNPNKLPYTSDVPDSALILRKHGMESNLFSCLLFNELEGFNPRDQLAFAYVRDHMRPKPKVNMFEVEVFERIAVEYRHNLKPGRGTTTPIVGIGSNGSHIRRTKWASTDSRFVSVSCQKYLSEMWGESHV